MSRYSHISVAVPAMDEAENLPLLLHQLSEQSFRQFDLYLCVNQPDSWWTDSDSGHLRVCQSNRQSIDLVLSAMPSLPFPVHVINRSTPGQGWSAKRKGVGWARKELFAQIQAEKTDNELIVSLDADTRIAHSYLELLASEFNQRPHLSAIAVPYYHPLSGNETLDRPMLRYECYMRHYLLHLLRIGSPYAFTALGSAMAFPLWAYRRVGGITPLQGGEDFYLLQKFAKTGSVATRLQVSDNLSPLSPAVVRPQGRASARVPFGTGPAIAKGTEALSESYPFFNDLGFKLIDDTYALFPTLYGHDVETPMSSFLRQQLATDDLWGPLRKNFKTPQQFTHACAERVDGLRILQFLKSNPGFRMAESQLPVDFPHDTIDTIDQYRNELFRSEMQLRK